MTKLFTLSVLLVLASGLALADGAIVINKDFGLCGMPGSDASGNLIFGGFGQITHVVENGNKITMKCKSDNVVNLSGKAQSFKGFGCGVFNPPGGTPAPSFTTDSHATVSASGGASGPGNSGTLTCTVTKP